MSSSPPPSSAGARATMLANRRRDTKPELVLRQELHRRGLRYRVDFAPIRGLRCRPDLVFTRARVAVFVDGCFWHRCPVHGTAPVANGDWWRAKLDGNVARDRRNDRALREAGWEVLRVWEHEPLVDAAGRVVVTVRRARERLKATSELLITLVFRNRLPRVDQCVMMLACGPGPPPRSISSLVPAA